MYLSFSSLKKSTKPVLTLQKQLKEAEYGTDVQTVKVEYERHQKEHKVIDQFQGNVEKCREVRTRHMENSGNSNSFHDFYLPGRGQVPRRGTQDLRREDDHPPKGWQLGILSLTYSCMSIARKGQ